MDTRFLSPTADDIDGEHICCAFSDKKYTAGYALKKAWLKREFANGFVFRRLDDRAKVFIEYCPAESAWIPVDAPNYLVLHCLWVSGRHQGKGHAKTLLRFALEDAHTQGRDGLAVVAGTAKAPFLYDTKWLLRQGFEEVERLSYGFSLLVKKVNERAPAPRFRETVLSGECPGKEGLVAYYSNRCPFTEHHVNISLAETARKRNMPITIIKLATVEQAQAAPTPATIFSLFHAGGFVTTDIGACLDARFDKALAGAIKKRSVAP